MRPESFDSLALGVFKTNKGWCAAAWTPKGLSALVLLQGLKEKALQKISGYLPSLPEEFWDKPIRPVPTAI